MGKVGGDEGQSKELGIARRRTRRARDGKEEGPLAIHNFVNCRKQKENAKSGLRDGGGGGGREREIRARGLYQK